MDLLDIDTNHLYFEEPMSETVSELLQKASLSYGQKKSESYLLKAYFLEPDNLSVLVALYRYYYYQHKFEDALRAAKSALSLVANRIDFPMDWKKVNSNLLANAIIKSMGMVRFYMMTLKAEAYLYLRIGEINQGRERLEKVAQLDTKDHFGAAALLRTISNSDLTDINPISAN